MRRAVLAALLPLLLVAPSGARADDTPGLVVLPVRSRGVAPADQKRIVARILAGYRTARPDVLGPDEVFARLARDERHKSALEEARRAVADGADRYRNLDFNGAADRFGRALQLYHDHFGLYADPDGYAQVYLWRGAQRLSSNDPAGAKADFYAAATIAPGQEPSTDDFPPTVIDAFEAARAERMKHPLTADQPDDLGSLAAALGVPAVATTRVERGPDGAEMELSIWAIPITLAPTRSTKIALSPVLEADADRIGSAAAVLAGGSRVAVAPPDPIRRRPRPPRPIGPETPIWRRSWLWASVAGIAAVGAAGGVMAWQQDQQSKPGPGFKVILQPPAGN